MRESKIKIRSLLLLGFFVNIIVYSIATTLLLIQSGAVEVEMFLFIPVVAWGVLPGLAYLCQISGIIIGLLSSAIPVRLLGRRLK